MVVPNCLSHKKDLTSFQNLPGLSLIEQLLRFQVGGSQTPANAQEQLKTHLNGSLNTHVVITYEQWNIHYSDMSHLLQGYVYKSWFRQMYKLKKVCS